MKRYVIRCLQGTSSVTQDIVVVATSFAVARQICCANGLMPVQYCYVGETSL